MLAGFGITVFEAANTRHLLPTSQLDVFLLLTLFTIIGELFPIKIKPHDQVTDITISTTFSFALLLILGPFAATLAQGAASVADDIRHRKPLWKSIFNVAQYAVALHAGALILDVFLSTQPAGGLLDFDVRHLPVIALAATTFFLVNASLIGIAVAIAQTTSWRSYFREIGDDLRFAGVDAMLMALSPIVMVAANESLLLIPLLALPLAAVHKSASVSLEKDHLVERVREQADQNEYQATHDALTGLPNRILFQDRLQQAIQVSNRTGASVGVMLMDLDRFKEINDALGHQTGDTLLIEIAHRLRGAVRAVDTVGRLGGDEFAIVVPEIARPEEAAVVAQRILDLFAAPFVLHGMHLHVEASVGVAMYPEQGHTVELLMQRADVAMYSAKSAHSGYEYYAPDDDHHSPARLAMVDELRRAISAGGLVVHYQPKVDLTDRRVTGVEALVRWDHPRRGLLPPMEFIELAEQSGLIAPLTMRVLDLALEDCSRWLKEGLDVGIAVNVSLQSLLNLELPTAVQDLLDKWQVPPESLTLEITESCMMADPARTLRTLNRLHEMRVNLAVDDFGTGYSSLAYLNRLPVSEIKIDRSFVMDMLNDDGNAVIAQSTIDLGKNLGLKVVAEGVSSQEIFDRLTELGCDVAQGFHIARPLDEPTLRGFLTESEYRPKPVASNLFPLPRAIDARASG